MGQYSQQLRDLIKAAGITRAQAADLLHVSPHTIRAWVKGEGSKSASEAPPWAPELLAYKTGQPLPKPRAETAPSGAARGRSLPRRSAS